MPQYINQLIMVCLAVIVPLAHAEPLPSDLANIPLSTLEQKLTQIDADLGHLARLSLRSGVGAIGYRSKTHTDPNHTEWVEIQLAQEDPIDQIVLVPTIWRDTHTGFRGDGFPAQFRILTGTDDNRKGTVVAKFNEQDNLTPRIAPLVVSIPETNASWIRIEASKLSPRGFDGKFIFQLAEVFIFSGQNNVALRKPVKCSSADPTTANIWSSLALVDGFIPYLMDASSGDQSLAYVRSPGNTTNENLTIDLESPQLLSSIHIHAIDQSDTVPQAYAGDLGIPQLLRIEGATQADFADAKLLADYRHETIYDAGPIIMRNFPETVCRYVRLTMIEPYITQTGIDRSWVGFAEIELFSNGHNVALNKSAKDTFDDKSNRRRSIKSLTDGNNLYGKIIPLKDWMSELANRHDLEVQRPIIAAELALRYSLQKQKLRRLIWLVTLLVAGLGITILVDWIIRTRKVRQLRERFAADLHDELGANIHAIGLLGDVALNAVDSPDKLRDLLQRSRQLTERTASAVRYCSSIQETGGLHENLPADMRRAANSIMIKLDHDISIEGEDYINKLKPRTKHDLFLFFKEVLVNTSRHADATRLTTRLTADRNEVCLSMADDGRGLPEDRDDDIPSSLKRRARLLRANVSAEKSESGGTCITLKFPTSRLRFRR